MVIKLCGKTETVATKREAVFLVLPRIEREIKLLLQKKRKRTEGMFGKGGEFWEATLSGENSKVHSSGEGGGKGRQIY